MSWKVCVGPRRRYWIGIIETNYEFAAAYWIPRGYVLVPGGEA
jgi:hypothetical protein